MESKESKVLNLEDYRKKAANYDNEKVNEISAKRLPDSFYDELRNEKRKEKGLLWD